MLWKPVREGDQSCASSFCWESELHAAVCTL